MVQAVAKSTDAGIVQVLQALLNIKGVTAVAMVGRDGFVIEHLSNKEVDIDALGAMVASVVGASESLGQEFDLGPMDQYLSEFASGKVIMTTALNDLIAVFTDHSAVIGGIRYAIKKNMPQIIAALE